MFGLLITIGRYWFCVCWLHVCLVCAFWYLFLFCVVLDIIEGWDSGFGVGRVACGFDFRLRKLVFWVV